MTAEGWAVIDKTGINIRTVSPARRGAIVNWLVVEAGVPIHNHYTDEQIEALWKKNCVKAKVLPVRIMA